MAIIARLAGEGIGPFKSFDFDFSDAAGNPHSGPHIFAGINGSGKSTILRTLAWMFEYPGSSDGFPWQEWQHLIQGHESSRAMVVISDPSLTLGRKKPVFAWAQTMDTSEGWEERLRQWMKQLLADRTTELLKGEGFREIWPESDPLWSIPRAGLTNRRPTGYLRLGGPSKLGWRQRVLAAAYGPSRLLKYLQDVDLSARLKNPKENSLSFESTVSNEVVQSWLLGLLSKEALAKTRGQSGSKYSTALKRFEGAVKHICEQDIHFNAEIEPSLHLIVRAYGKWLDFSQLPDGVRSILGWLADFMMRMDLSDRISQGQRYDEAEVLLLDEIDAHLHPRWQRAILPSIKEALPEVQVFATSHSPFVIASCPGARIHVLKLDENGHASNEPPLDAPVGESILATMKDIFGVSSRFDVVTEKLLEEWNQLRRNEAAGTLSSKDKKRMTELAKDLGSRSEELRQIVTPVIPISESLINSLQSAAEPLPQRRITIRKAK